MKPITIACLFLLFCIVQTLASPVYPTVDEPTYFKRNGTSIKDKAQEQLDEIERRAEKIYNQYETAMWIIAMVFGLVECFFGLRLMKLTLFIVGFTIFSVAIYFSISHFAAGHNYTPYLAIGCAVVGGILGGALAIFLLKLGIFCIGAGLGVVITLLLHALFLHYAHPSNPKLVLYIAAPIVALIFGLLAIKIGDYLIIFATALNGAFGFVKGVGHFAGHFPNELNNHNIRNLDWRFYVYVAGLIVLFVIGALVQHRMLVASKQQEQQQEFGHHDYERYDERRRKGYHLI